MLYISLTTKPDRIKSDHFKNVYYSLKNQLHKFDFLVINLSINDFTYDFIPKYLVDDKQVILNKTDICGPCAKLIGSFNIIPNDSIVIIIDDDMIFKDIFISSLFNSHKKNPNKVITSSSLKEKYFNDVRGFSGYIFLMTDTIRELEKHYIIMPKCAKFIDDTWFGLSFLRLGIDVIEGDEDDYWNNLFDIPNTDQHPKWNELCENTDRGSLIYELVNLNTIKIGSSNTNTKIVKLNDDSSIFNLIKLNNLSSRQTKLYFNHKFNDTFSYIIKDNLLYIKRTDRLDGWGQNLVCYF